MKKTLIIILICIIFVLGIFLSYTHYQKKKINENITNLNSIIKDSEKNKEITEDELNEYEEIKKANTQKMEEYNRWQKMNEEIKKHL